MARDVTSILAGFAAQKRSTYLLVDIDDATTPLRITNWDSEVSVTLDAVLRVFSANDVTASGIGQDGQRGGMQDCSITIQNIDNVVAGMALGSEGMLGRHVRIWEGWLHPDSFSFLDAKKLFDGRADSISWDETSATINLVPHDTPWVLLVPGHQFFTSCVNKFKGTLCQYAGADTDCERTYAACLLKTNTPNFNGFRFLPDPTKKYFWSGDSGTRIPTREA